MKNIFDSKILGLACAVLLLSTSCKEDDLVTPKEGDYTKIGNPYVQVNSPVVAFQAGTPDYDISFNALNGLRKLSSVNLYITYFDAASSTASDNEVLLKTYPISEPIIQLVEDKLTYDMLKAGLTVDGSPLPSNQVDLAIGSLWSVRFEATYTDGGTGAMPGAINIGVLHRFAGQYKVLSSSYYRIGVLTADWAGQTRFIGSVDENTFVYSDYWGSFAFAGKGFHFDVDYANGNKITVPITVFGLFSGTYALDCAVNSDKFSKISCTGSNVVIADDVTGKHKIYLTYGYFTDGSGPREFQEVLEKIVD